MLPGYTLVEVMATMTISTILIMMVFRSVLFTNRIAITWIEKFNFRQTVSMISRRISRDLEKNGLEFCTDSIEFNVNNSNRPVPLYEYKSGNFSRQRKLINQDRLRIDSFDVILGLRDFNSDTILFETLSKIGVSDTARIGSEMTKCCLETIGFYFSISDNIRSDTIQILHLLRPNYCSTFARNYSLKYLGIKDSSKNG